MIEYLLTFVLLLLVAPLLTGCIKSLKMFLLFKRPVSCLQNYYTFAKLLKKELLISKEASFITHIAPFMVLAPLLVALLFLPPVSKSMAYIPFADAFTFTGLVALSGFFLMLIGLDSASSFGGIGSSREAFIAALVEPAMILVLFSLSLMAGHIDLGGAALAFSHHFPKEHMASFTFAAISFFILLIAENGRIPVDNPETHLELTMVHEVMILDIGGFYLALVEAASSLKFTLFSAFFAAFFLPFSVGCFPIDLALFVLKLFVVALLVALIEVSTAKLRLFKVPNLLGIAIVFAFLSLISFYMLGA